ncbi:MAG TPA: redoxin domain-containing protein [Terriglobales bacterium]|nr:redoxin domain-containing protein [Terriglobales bacterium]
MIQVGDKAPDFDLPVLIGGVRQRFRLHEQQGRHIVLAFYPYNWEPTSTEQFTRYQVDREELLACDAEVVGISVDSIMNTTAWEREIGPLDFPLCSDFWPHGEVCSRYGLLRLDEPVKGASERAILIVDKTGTIAFRKVYGLNDLPDIDELFDWLRTLRAA